MAHQADAPSDHASPAEESIAPFAGSTLLCMILFLAVLPHVASLWGGAGRLDPKTLEGARITIRGVGPIRFGMTVDEASNMVGSDLVRSENWGGESEGCYYVEPAAGPQGVFFMVIDQRIERVDVSSTAVESRSGAKVGSSEDWVYHRFPGQVEVKKHAYNESGHSLVFTPRDRADKSYRMIFDTDGTTVTMIRAGRLPAVEYDEGCL